MFLTASAGFEIHSPTSACPKRNARRKLAVESLFLCPTLESCARDKHSCSLALSVLLIILAF